MRTVIIRACPAPAALPLALPRPPDRPCVPRVQPRAGSPWMCPMLAKRRPQGVDVGVNSSRPRSCDGRAEAASAFLSPATASQGLQRVPGVANRPVTRA